MKSFVTVRSSIKVLCFKENQHCHKQTRVRSHYLTLCVRCERIFARGINRLVHILSSFLWRVNIFTYNCVLILIARKCLEGCCPLKERRVLLRCWELGRFKTLRVLGKRVMGLMKSIVFFLRNFYFLIVKQFE